LLRYGFELVAILNASLQHAAATMALVLAMAGMMRLTTPCVRLHVTPAILCSSARARATSYSHWMCSGSSLSSFLSASARDKGQLVELELEYER